MSAVRPDPGSPPRPLRVANCSGFFGDRLSAAREMVDGGPIDVLTGDWLAELTMLILARQQQRRPEAGYARTFVTQMSDVLGDCVGRGIRVVSNAGGQNPHGCAEAVRALCAEQGIDAVVAVVTGDDLLPRLDAVATRHPLTNVDTGELLDDTGMSAVTANAYLGAWGIVEALGAGADVVITGRVTDAALVVGPAAWWFGWERTAVDELAGAVVAGHVIECGTQCTGGNYAFFEDVPGLEHPGFPIAEIEADGSFVVTKHPGTGGSVQRGTVTAQLLYEIQGVEYANPDVVVELDSINLADAGPDRVRVSGVRGRPAPDRVKVAVNAEGGWRNAMTFAITGIDVDHKVALVERTLWSELGGRDNFDHSSVEVIGRFRPDDPQSNADAITLLRIAVADTDRTKVGRDFSDTVMGMLLASYPGMFTTTPPTEAAPVGVYWPVLVPWDEVACTVEIGDARIAVPAPPFTAPFVVTPPASTSVPPHRAPAHTEGGESLCRVPLGTLVGARSGDKGGNANVGVWARTDAVAAWLPAWLTAERLAALLGPDADGCAIERYDLPNLGALNFVVRGLLGRGVAATTRFDPQAKGLGEYLRARLVDVPEDLLDRD